MERVKLATVEFWIWELKSWQGARCLFQKRNSSCSTQRRLLPWQRYLIKENMADRYSLHRVPERRTLLAVAAAAAAALSKKESVCEPQVLNLNLLFLRAEICVKEIVSDALHNQSSCSESMCPPVPKHKRPSSENCRHTHKKIHLPKKILGPASWFVVERMFDMEKVESHS